MNKIINIDTLELHELDDKQIDQMCEICENTLFCQPMNTNQYNQCEGSNCDLAFDLFISELKKERDKNIKLIEDVCKLI